MHDESARKSSVDTALTAARTGKAIADIAKGAAVGGAYGAVIGITKASKKWIPVVATVVVLPVLFIAMLPTIIFGKLFGDGTDSPSGFTDDAVLVQNIVDINTSISTVLSEGLADVLDRIDQDFEESSCDSKEVNNPYGTDVVFNANAFVSMYCASKCKDVTDISLEDMAMVLTKGKAELYSFSYQDVSREVEPESDDEESTTLIVRIYTIAYNGESYFADEVFHLDDEQKHLSNQYAQNLTVLLSDGVYQKLSSLDTIGSSTSYEGIVFKDGATRVIYYNQLDKRWANTPYGTDTIGGYACGPTAMSIVIPSLTAENIDPPHMAQWAYENGYWCSGNGSYHSLIPGAANAWGLKVEGCTASEPQRIVDALSEGKLVVAIMSKGHFTSSGHFIVLRGVTADGRILVADPANVVRSEKTWDMSIILAEASKRAGAGGPFWIIGK